MRILTWFDDRLVLQEIFDDISSKFIFPHNIRRMAIIVVWAVFYCFGGLVLTAFLVQVATGFALTFYYHPTVGDALNSVRAIMNDGACFPIGRITDDYPIQQILVMRSSWHRWAASVMVCGIILHVCRVYLTGGFKKPREVTWITGVTFTVSFGVTGYSLPYDQVGYWALRIVSGVPDCIPVIGTTLVELIRGGPSVGQLTRFYRIGSQSTSFILVEAYHHSSGIDIGVSICSIRYPEQQYKCLVIKVSVQGLGTSANEPIPRISSEDRDMEGAMYGIGEASARINDVLGVVLIVAIQVPSFLIHSSTIYRSEVTNSPHIIYPDHISIGEASARINDVLGSVGLPTHITLDLKGVWELLGLIGDDGNDVSCNLATACFLLNQSLMDGLMDYSLVDLQHNILATDQFIAEGRYRLDCVGITAAHHYFIGDQQYMPGNIALVILHDGGLVFNRAIPTHHLFWRMLLR